MFATTPIHSVVRITTGVSNTPAHVHTGGKGPDRPTPWGDNTQNHAFGDIMHNVSACMLTCPCLAEGIAPFNTLTNHIKLARMPSHCVHGNGDSQGAAVARKPCRTSGCSAHASRANPDLCVAASTDQCMSMMHDSMDMRIGRGKCKKSLAFSIPHTCNKMADLQPITKPKHCAEHACMDKLAWNTPAMCHTSTLTLHVRTLLASELIHERY